jgi:hypothetical protein
MAAPTNPPGRTGTRIVALILAVLFLAVIGGSIGYILGLRHNHSHPRVVDNGAPAPTTAGPGGGGSRGGGSGNGGTGNGGGKPCLSDTERDAKNKFGSPGGLTQVFYLKTNQDEAWICQDSDNTVFYQGHLRSPAEQQGAPRPPLVDLKNSLLLKTVSREGAGWVAVNDSGGGSVTRYHVSTAELVIEQPGQEPKHHPAIAHEP